MPTQSRDKQGNCECEKAEVEKKNSLREEERKMKININN